MKKDQILNSLFEGEGTQFEFDSELKIHNENLKLSPVKVTSKLDVDLKELNDKCQVTLNLAITDPEDTNRQAIRLTVKRRFLESLMTLLLEAEGSVKIEKITD